MAMPRMRHETKLSAPSHTATDLMIIPPVRKAWSRTFIRPSARVGADADITDVAVLMTDYNLITIPVVDAERRLLGVITVDDVLEVTLPEDWRRREAAEPPDTRHGDAR